MSVILIQDEGERGILKAPLFRFFVIPLSKDGGPLFRQIYLGLRQAILQGTLRPGERLPSTRELAAQLGVSRTVILVAFDQLLAEGFVEGRAGSGTYAASALEKARPKPSQGSARLRLSRFGTTVEALGSKAHAIQRKKTIPYDFSHGGSDIQRFPFETWRRIMMRRLQRGSLREFDYGPAAGSVALREAIAEHLRRSRAMACDASQIIIVNGSQQALDLASRVLLERGDCVAIEDPQYQGARQAFQAAGAKLHRLPVDFDGLNPAKLPRRARIASVTPTHQFPTGALLPLARRLALLEWAKRADAIVIEDDYDGEFHYEGLPLESLQALDTDGRVIYVGSFSRTIFPALRLGYLIVPKSIVPAFTSAKRLCDRHTATIEQETLAEFIAIGAYGRHLRRLRRENAIRRRTLLDAIQECLGQRVQVVGDRSGAHISIWPSKTMLSEETILARAAAMGVGIYGVSRFFIKPPKRVGLLLGYSRLKEHEIREGIRRLSEIL